MRLDLRADLQEAFAWLTGNIHTTEDAERLAEMLDRVKITFPSGGSRASEVDSAICHFWGGRADWSPTICRALEILRARYGRLWNYAGD